MKMSPCSLKQKQILMTFLVPQKYAGEPLCKFISLKFDITDLRLNTGRALRSTLASILTQ